MTARQIDPKQGCSGVILLRCHVFAGFGNGSVDDSGVDEPCSQFDVARDSEEQAGHIGGNGGSAVAAVCVCGGISFLCFRKA